MMSATNLPPRRHVRFGTNLVWLEIAALAALMAFKPSPSLLVGGLMVVWGTVCWIGRLTFRDGGEPGRRVGGKTP